MEINKIKCNCSCHKSNGMELHMQACCDNSWIDIPVVGNKVYVKDGTWLKYYQEDGTAYIIQHMEFWDGKIEFNPEWKILEEKIGTVYVVKPKKDEA